MPRLPKVYAQPAQVVESGSESVCEIEVPVIKNPREKKTETLAESKPQPKKPGNKRTESYVLTDARKAQFEKARKTRNEMAAIQNAKKRPTERRWKNLNRNCQRKRWHKYKPKIPFMDRALKYFQR
jgi:hypothetical protein